MIHVYNVAVRRPDNKVETDTMYSEKILSQADADDISRHFGCDIIISRVGHFVPDKEGVVAKYTFYASVPCETIEEEVKSDDTEV